MEGSVEPKRATVSLKKQIKIAIYFQVIVPGSALIYMLVINRYIFFDSGVVPIQEFNDAEKSGSGLGRLTRSFFLVLFGLTLILKIVITVLLCNGAAQRNKTKLCVWITLEILLSSTGIISSVSMYIFNHQYSSLPIASLFCTLTTIISIFSIISVGLFLRRIKLGMTDDYDDIISLRFEPRARSRAQSYINIPSSSAA